MANFYTDIPELRFHLNNPMMERIFELNERNYQSKEEFHHTPQNYHEALVLYAYVL